MNHALQKVVEHDAEARQDLKTNDRSARALWKRVMRDPALKLKSEKLMSVEQRLIQHLRALTETARHNALIGTKKPTMAIKLQLLATLLRDKRRAFQREYDTFKKG